VSCRYSGIQFKESSLNLSNKTVIEMRGYRFFRYGLSAKTLQEDLPNHHEVLPFQEACTERHGNVKEVICTTDFIRYRLLETNE